MQNPDHDSVYLLQEPATPQAVERLYEKGLLNQEGKEHALNLLAPRNWKVDSLRLLKIVGMGLIVLGFIVLFITNWQQMSPRYHQVTLFISILVCIYGCFVYLDNYRASQSWLAAAIVFTVLNLIFIDSVPHANALPWALAGLLIGLILAFSYRMLKYYQMRGKLV